MATPSFYYLFIYIFITSISALSFYYSFYGIYILQKNKTKNIAISPMIKIFFLYSFVWSLISTIYNFYMAIFWRPNSIIYNSYIIYFFSMPSLVLLLFNPIIEIFLCFDRCISITIPKTYSTNFRKYVCIAFVFTSIFIVFLTTYGNGYLERFPKSSETFCPSHLCVVTVRGRPHGIYITFAMGPINILSGLILYYLIKTRISTSTVVKSTNKTVVWLIFLTTVLHFSPNLAYLILSRVIVISFEGGLIVTALESLNVAIGLRMYEKNFKRTTKNSIKIVTIAVNEEKRISSLDLRKSDF